MNKLKSIISLYKLSVIKRELQIRKSKFTPIIAIMLFVLGVMIPVFCGTLLKLNIAGMLGVSLAFILCIPTLLINKVSFDYQQKRFTDITNYMERLIYAYQKSGKIYTALKDVRDVANKDIADLINEVLAFIDDGEAEENLYREAFRIIEAKYKCSRLITLHNYLVDVELHGGKSDDALQILINDLRDWVIRTRTFRMQRKNVKSKVFLSIVLAIVTCVAALYMVPAEYTNVMASSQTYQLCTSIILSLYIILYDYTEKLIGKSFLDLELDGDREDLFYRAKNRIDKFDKSKSLKLGLVYIFISLVTIIVAYFLDYLVYSIPIVFIFLVAAYRPFGLYKSDTQRVENEVYKAIPIWVRNLTLQLQVNNVSISIQNSLKDAPFAIKDEIEGLLIGIEESPTSIEPYDTFCSSYSLQDVRLIANHLYYMTNFGSDDMLSQLDYMVKQNAQMTINEEEIRNSDALSVLSLLILVPMIISMLKLSVDMYLLFDVFSGIMMEVS